MRLVVGSLALVASVSGSSGWYVSSGSRQQLHEIRGGSVVRSVSVSSGVSAVCHSASQACVVVGCEDGTVWRLRRSEGPSQTKKPKQTTTTTNSEELQRCDTDTQTQSAVVALHCTSDDALVCVFAPNVVTLLPKLQTSGAATVLRRRFVQAQRVTAVCCLAAEKCDSALLQLLCPAEASVQQRSSDALLLCGSDDGTVYCSLALPVASIGAVGKSGDASAVLGLFAVRLALVSEESGSQSSQKSQQARGRNLLNALVAVTAKGTILVWHGGSAPGLRSFSLGFEISSCCCSGTVLLMCPTTCSGPVIVNMADLNGFVSCRATGLPPCAGAVLEGSVVYAVARNGRLVQRDVGDLSSLEAFNNPQQRIGTGEVLQSIVSIWKEQDSVRRDIAAWNSRIEELRSAIKLERLKKQIEGKVQGRIDESGCVYWKVTIVNRSAHDISSRWAVALCVSKFRVQSVALARGVKAAGGTAVVRIACKTLPTNCSMQLRLLLVHCGTGEDWDMAQQRLLAPSLSFHESHGAGLIVDIGTSRVSLLDFVFDGSKDTRSVVVPAVAPLKEQPSTGTRTFRFQLGTALVQDSDSFSIETVFGTEVSVNVRNGPDNVSELTLVCPNAGIEAYALRAAILLRLLARLPRRGGKKSEWRDYKSAITAANERLSSVELSVSELMEIYTEMRRWKLNTIE